LLLLAVVSAIAARESPERTGQEVATTLTATENLTAIGWRPRTASRPGRAWRRTRQTVQSHAGDLAALIDERLRPRFDSIWVVGGGLLAGECLRLGLADEIRYSILPVVIGEGIPFFGRFDREVALHLAEVTACQNGVVDLHYEVRSIAPPASRPPRGNSSDTPAR
jgi:riboflavin biosynthesis pyrimidine reductase